MSTSSEVRRRSRLFRRLGALDKLGLLVLPIVLRDGMRLTPALSTDSKLTLEDMHPLPEGTVEIVSALA